MADLYGYVACSFLCWAALNPNKTYIQVVQIAFLISVSLSRNLTFCLLWHLVKAPPSAFPRSGTVAAWHISGECWPRLATVNKPHQSFLTWHHTEHLLTQHPWKWSGWMGLWAIWSGGRCPCIQQEVGTRQSLRSLPTQTFPWFSAPPLKIGVK